MVMGGPAQLGAAAASGASAATQLGTTDLAVAAALSRRPFGLRSARAVAKAAGRSHSCASRSLRRLEAAGIVRRREDRVAEGTPRTVAVWTIDWCSPAWHTVAAEVGSHTSASCTAPSPSLARLPSRLAHLFWNVELGCVDLERHGTYVASRILRSNDCQALGWLARHLGPEHLRAAAGGRGLDPRRAQLARLLAGAEAAIAPANAMAPATPL
ncbi:MAG: hypothetical protein GEV08_05745 [Acidimicrobiia bacterium]|nr:hypothetical protein [Acidimicrobiia bacterium]